MAKRSGFRIKFRIEMRDGTEYEVTAGIADAVRFEVTKNRPVTDERGRIQIADLMWLAWAASFREDFHKVKRFEDWYPLVADADQVDEPTAEDGGDESGGVYPDEGPTESPSRPETS